MAKVIVTRSETLCQMNWSQNTDEAIDKWLTDPCHTPVPAFNALLSMYKRAIDFENTDRAHRIAYVAQSTYKHVDAHKMICKEVDDYRIRWYSYMSMNTPSRVIYPYPPVRLPLSMLISLQLCHPNDMEQLYVEEIFLHAKLYAEYGYAKRLELPSVFTKCLVEHVQRYFNNEQDLSVRPLLTHDIVNSYGNKYKTWTFDRQSIFVHMMFEIHGQPDSTHKTEFSGVILGQVAYLLKRIVLDSEGRMRSSDFFDMHSDTSLDLKVRKFAALVGWHRYPDSYQQAHVRRLSDFQLPAGDLFSYLWADPAFPTDELWTYIRMVTDLRLGNPAIGLAVDVLSHPAWHMTIKRAYYAISSRKRSASDTLPYRRPEFYTSSLADLRLLESRKTTNPVDDNITGREVKFDSEHIRFDHEGDMLLRNTSLSVRFSLYGSNAEGTSVVSDIVGTFWREALRRGYMIVLHDEWHLGPADHAHDPSWLYTWGMVTSYWLLRGGYLPMRVHSSVWSFLAYPFRSVNPEKDDPALVDYYQGDQDYYPKSEVLGHFAEGFRRKTSTWALELIVSSGQAHIFVAPHREINADTFLSAMNPSGLSPELVQVILECTPDCLTRLLVFITGQPRLPSSDLSEPLMTVHWENIPLPRAQNCFSVWLLPEQCKHNIEQLRRFVRLISDFETTFVSNERSLLLNE